MIVLSGAILPVKLRSVKSHRIQKDYITKTQYFKLDFTKPFEKWFN